MSALERLAKGEADGLVVAKLDRLTRSLADLTDLLTWADRLGVVLVALDFGLDTSNPTGRLVARLVGSVAEWEREVIAARTREAAAVKRLRGERWGGLAGVADTAPNIAERIRRERVAGSTWQAIADRLNRDKVPTVRGGTHWRVSSVQTAAGYRRRPRPLRRVALPEPSRGGRRRVAAS
jgi:DNA invertase Pin-like site-specific DNA recombinase